MNLLNASWFQLPQDQVPSPLMAAVDTSMVQALPMQMPKPRRQPAKEKQSTVMEYSQSVPASVGNQSSWEPLLASLSNGFQERQGDIKALEAQLAQAPESEASPFMQANLKPLMALTDQLAGTNYSAGYAGPQKEDLSLRQKLAEALEKKKQGLADDQIALIKELNDSKQFDENLKQKMEYTNLWGDLKRAQIDAAAARASAEKASTAPQFLAAGFAKRIQQTSDVFDRLASEGYQGLTRGDQVRSYLPNELQNKNAQLYDQAARNFINAVLRRESGAAISDGEFANAYTQYLPKPGDTPEQLAQKRANRQQVFENLKAEASGAFQKVPYIDPNQGIQAPKGMAKVLSPNGKIVSIPASQVDAAIKAGGKRVE